MISNPRFAATLIIGCALAMTACGTPANNTETTTSPDSTEHSSPTPAATPGDGTFMDPSAVDRSDVEATAEAAAMLLHSWDTTTDATQTAAAIRAKPLMSKEWASKQVEPERNGAQGAWLEPSQHQAFSVPSIVPAVGDTSQDVGKDKAIRAYNVQWNWRTRDGHEPLDGGQQHVTIYLEKHGGTWDVVGHTFG